MPGAVKRVLSCSWNIAWIGLLVTLPVTSFPPLSELAGGTQVAPLALIPLGWLALTWLPNLLIAQRTPFPAENRPLFGFLFATLISCLLAFFLFVPIYKSHSILSNEIDALITLGIGICFHVASTIPVFQTEAISRSIRYLSIGGAVMLLWSLAQAVVIWLWSGEYPGWMVDLHSALTTTSLLRLAHQPRVTGFAMEPSWQAHLLNVLYLPVWLAASRCRQSAFKLRIGRFILEDLLSVTGLLVLGLTFSRIGLLAIMLMAGWLIYAEGKNISFKTVKKIFPHPRVPLRPLQMLLGLLVLILFVLLFLGILFGLAFRDPRLVPLFQLGEQVTSPGFWENGLISLAHRLNFAERVIYWDLGWQVFERHPLFGVGLGNTGMFTIQELSSSGWGYVEVRRVLFVETFVPNTKNLWTRILSETGLVGSAFFITWLITLWTAGRGLRSARDRRFQVIGLAGQLAIVGLLVEGFSVDSFVLPYWWIMFGLLTSASSLMRGENGTKVIQAQDRYGRAD